MIVRSFYLRDIKKYEEENRVDLLSYLIKPSFTGITTLVSIGNGCCSIDYADEIVEEYLKQGNSLLSIQTELRNKILGNKSTDNTAKPEETFDVSSYKSLTELLSYYYWNMFKPLNFGYNEFWSMTTDELYKAFNMLVLQRVNEMNDFLYKAYIQAGLSGAGNWGKLPPRAPQVNIDKIKGHKNETKEERKKRLKQEVETKKAAIKAYNMRFKK